MDLNPIKSSFIKKLSGYKKEGENMKQDVKQDISQVNQTSEKKSKTWDEAILELKGFILKAKKEEMKEKTKGTSS